MQWGEIEVYPVSMGRFWLDGGSLFGVVPKVIWGKYHKPDDENRIEVEIRSLLIRTEKRLILVDAGIGANFNDKLKKIYKVDFAGGDPETSLGRLGFGTRDITDVIITHLHFDHVGGALRNANSTPEPVYANARFHVNKRQWEWACHPSIKDHGSYMKELYASLPETNELILRDGEWEIDPAVQVRIFDGHTPGLQLPLISNSHGSLFFAGDLVPVAAQTPVPFIMSFDINPLKTAEEKGLILGRAAAEKWLLFFQHDVAVEAAYIERGEKHFRITGAHSLN